MEQIKIFKSYPQAKLQKFEKLFSVPQGLKKYAYFLRISHNSDFIHHFFIFFFVGKVKNIKKKKHELKGQLKKEVNSWNLGKKIGRGKLDYRNGRNRRICRLKNKRRSSLRGGGGQLRRTKGILKDNREDKKSDYIRNYNQWQS